jgi:hypothetical protein
MPVEEAYRNDERHSDTRSETTKQIVSEESLVIRNYDASEPHDVRVQFLTIEGNVAFRRSMRIPAMETVTVRTRLRRAVYRVETELDEQSTDSAECLIGSGVDETALVEVGNGCVSVVEGLL